MERKKIGQMQGRISRRRLVRNPTIQYIIIILLSKYEYSSLHSFTEIFDEKFHYSKYGKKIGQIQGRISMRKLVRNPTIQYIMIILLTKYDYSCLHRFTEIFDEKFHQSKYGKKENWTNAGKNKQEKAGLQSPRYSMSSSICIPNMTFLACMVVEKSFTKKCYGITEGRTDGRTGGMTDRCKPYTPPHPHFFKAGI